MVDRELELKIKRLKEFMQVWIKFHDMYKDSIKRDTITPEEESTFLETKSLIARKYQALTEHLGMGPSYEDKTFDVISQVLSLKSVAAISDLSLHKIENDWHNSYILLNKLLGELEGRQEALRRVGLIRVIIGRLSVNPIVNLILAIIIISAIYFLINYIQTTQNIPQPQKIEEVKEEKVGGTIEFQAE